jgi:hypothetical protein
MSRTVEALPSPLGALYTCDHCDDDDPINGSAEKWTEGELQPPSL